MIRESAAKSGSGMFMLVLWPLLLLLSAWWLVQAARAGSAPQVVGAGLAIGYCALMLGGFFVVEPNHASVLMLFGNYRGSERRPGLWWANPFMTKKKITMRVRNFESNKLKVNDHDGNPIEIAAVVVWRVVDSAEAIFQVDNYDNFVHVQSEAALRNLALGHPYDAHQEGELSLRANTLEVAAQLQKEVQDRLEKAGVEVMEARISHLAYAPEIASAMLRRQQASAVIAARSKIVEGAVSMVQMALDELAKRSVVTLDEERKAAMVSNLLVVLCSEHETQPIVNAGTLYQ
jgi:regulator of protease activity HflC (stomatin/prohibitin superfamily)